MKKELISVEFPQLSIIIHFEQLSRAVQQYCGGPAINPFLFSTVYSSCSESTILGPIFNTFTMQFNIIAVFGLGKPFQKSLYVNGQLKLLRMIDLGSNFKHIKCLLMFPTYSRSLDILDKYYDTNLNPASPSILIYQCQSQRVINAFDSQQSHRVITYSGTASSTQNFPTSPKDMVFRSAPNSKFSYHPHQHKFSYSFFIFLHLMYDFTV